ncbi:hypothetical protein DEIPH_ctg033orf0003 [Deinococcus phoenicis]|uniref:Uncharacterized protein n=1 Tax=Deinococcus phoenicis TaxID=1476583 RepID=A0A016QPD0_9DEIO|nr:hypothetical protein [Deinococcus phoenicis]EYB67604.1 hypothetical protein DEIPH_ctg033orf0003 [Deinococcus phoenicis]
MTATNGSADDAQALLYAEGERLARRLTQTLGGGEADVARAHLLGLSLAVNLVNALVPTVEQVSRHAGRPLHAHVTGDDRGRAVVETVTPDGERHTRLPVDDLLDSALYRGGRLHPTVHAHLAGAMQGSEHHAARALAACLKSAPVLDALRLHLTALLKTA